MLSLAKTLTNRRIGSLPTLPEAPSAIAPGHVEPFLLRIWSAVGLFRNRRNLVVENLVLWQQLIVLIRRHPRPRLDLLDKLFWVALVDSGQSLRARRCKVERKSGERYSREFRHQAVTSLIC
jgi:hypothetical protein